MKSSLQKNTVRVLIGRTVEINRSANQITDCNFLRIDFHHGSQLSIFHNSYAMNE